MIVEGAGTLFGADVVDAFRQMVMPYPVGSDLELPDGRRGVVCDVDRREPHAPVVRVHGPRGPVEERVDMRPPVPA